ncbi:MAG TPA: hypothetical protein VMV39_02765 [Terracidiphilus sp.]|nr:hypothetical protein [Terracidiphilus sp.]
MNISLTDAMRHYIEQQLGLRHYSSGSEYMRDLIRKDQIEQQRGEQLRDLETLLKERLQAKQGSPMDDAYFERLRELLHEEHAS